MAEPIVWIACPGAAEVAIGLPHAKLVYQRSDRYEDFPGLDSKQIKLYDQLLKRHADLVIYVNRDLWMQEKAECKKAIFLDHGVDYELFAHAHRDQHIPEEIRRIPHPIVGLFSQIDEHKVDFPLVEGLSDILSDMSIVLIGGSNVDLSGLESRKNIYLLGRKPYEQVPHYAKCFDVCFLPFPQNRWIEAANPIKLKEYLALGKPIVSVPFSAIETYKDLVYVASDVNEFAEAVREACNENDPELVAARRAQVSGSTWEAKAIEAMQALYEVTLTPAECHGVS
jgi:glycosyltransferase involved in cell wall biosynthesis